MQLDRFTTMAQKALADAHAGAASRSHAELTPLHLLVAMLEDPGAVACALVERAGVNAGQVAQVASSELGRLPSVSGGSPQITTSTDLVQVLTAAEMKPAS